MKSDQSIWRRKMRKSFIDHSMGRDLPRLQPNYRQQQRNRKYRKSLRKGIKPSTPSNFNHHSSFKKKCFFSKSSNFGRAVHTAKTLQVGEVAIVNRSYVAAVATDRVISYCLTCHETRANFIQCKKCKMVFFCSKQCQTDNMSHRFECGTQFHKTEDMFVKCAIQIVLEAMATFDHFADLKNFIAQSINDVDDIPKGSNTRKSKFDCILKLKRAEYKCSYYYYVLVAYELIITFPKVQEYFPLENSVGHDFLQDFLMHNVLAITSNAFGNSLLTKEGQFDSMLLFDVVSYINHSCSPNLLCFMDKTEITLVTSQRIQAGEQLFISYRNFCFETKPERQIILRNWEFECHCVSCEFGRDINFNEIQRANQMCRQQIEHRLNKFSKWTPQKGAYIRRYLHILGN